MGTLIDTSVFIAIERGQLALETVASHPGSMAISAVTASELLHGVERAAALRRDKRQRFVELPRVVKRLRERELVHGALADLVGVAEIVQGDAPRPKLPEEAGETASR